MLGEPIQLLLGVAVTEQREKSHTLAKPHVLVPRGKPPSRMDGRKYGIYGIIAEFARYVGIHIQDNLDKHLWTKKMYTPYSILGPSDSGIKIPSLGLRGYSETSHDHQSFQVEAKTLLTLSKSKEEFEEC